MSGIAVIVVTHNSGRVIGPCLESLGRFSEGVEEITVVDNASRDDTAERVASFRSQVRWVPNPENRGFAAAVNQGAALTRSPLVLLLNPDCVLRSSAAPLAEACLAPNTAAAGGRLVSPEGEPQAGFNVRAFPSPAALACETLGINRLWPGNPVNRRYRQAGWDPGLATVVEQPAGAFLMVRRAVLEKLGGLDERFHPLWFEDVDLCLRIRQAGWAIRYAPEAVAEHAGGHSLASLSDSERNAAWYGSLLRFSDKHFHPLTAGSLRWLVLIGLSGRWLAAFVQGGSARKRQSYARVASGLLRRSLAVGGPEACVPGTSSPAHSRTS